MASIVFWMSRVLILVPLLDIPNTVGLGHVVKAEHFPVTKATGTEMEISGKDTVTSGWNQQLGDHERNRTSSHLEKNAVLHKKPGDFDKNVIPISGNSKPFSYRYSIHNKNTSKQSSLYYHYHYHHHNHHHHQDHRCNNHHQALGKSHQSISKDIPGKLTPDKKEFADGMINQTSNNPYFLSASTSPISPSPSTKTKSKQSHRPKKHPHDHRLKHSYNFSLKREYYNYIKPSISLRHPISSGFSSKARLIPRVPSYRPLYRTPLSPGMERTSNKNDKEIRSIEEINGIRRDEKGESSVPVSAGVSSSLVEKKQRGVNGADENYIMTPALGRFSIRSETGNGPMAKPIRRKRAGDHEKFTHGWYDSNDIQRNLPPPASLKETTMHENHKGNSNHYYEDNQFTQRSRAGASKSVQSPIDSINNSTVSSYRSVKANITDGEKINRALQNGVEKDHLDSGNENNYLFNHHRRRHRRQLRQRRQLPNAPRRPRVGQRSRTNPFRGKFGSGHQGSRFSSTNLRRNRNTTASGQPVSLKVIVHTGLSKNYERVLKSSINILMNKQYRMLLEYITPSGSLVRLRNDMPKDILQAFCNDILRSNTTSVVHLMNPFHHRRHWESAGYVSSLLATLNIPRITWGPQYIGAMYKKESDRSDLNISPTLQHQARALVSLMTNYKWPFFAVVYTRIPGYDTFLASMRMALDEHYSSRSSSSDNNNERDNNKHGNNNRRKESVELRLELLTTVEVSNTSDSDRTRNELNGVKKTDARVIILFCKQSQTLHLLAQASKLGMMGKEYLWILTFEAINKNQNQNAKYLPVGLLGLQYNYREAAMEQAIRTAVHVWLEGLNKAVQSTIATTSSSSNASSLPAKPKGLPWKLPNLRCQSDSSMEWKSGREFYKFMKQASFDGVSFNELGQLETTNISILNVQSRRGRDAGKKWVEIGKWEKEAILMKQIVWAGGSRSIPSGKPRRHFLRIVTREEPPFVEYRDLNRNGSCDMFSSPCSIYLRDTNETRLSTNTTQKCCTGLSIEILRKLASALDFEFQLYEVPDFQWGTKMPDGEWNGIVGELRAGHADMSVASMTIDEDKSGAINFSVPYMETGITFIVAIREGAVSATAFLEPYDYPSWCLILVCSVHVTGASIFLFEWLSPDGMDHGKKTTSEHRFSLFRAFWLMWAMLFGAAVTTDTPRGVSSKFLSNIWALFALVFTASYTANLAAFMITKEEFYDLSGMQDWRLQQPYSVNPPFRFATVPNGTAESNIKKNNPKMYQYMSKFSQISVEHAIDALKSQDIHAFTYDASVLKYKEGKDKDCQLITVGNWYATTGYGVSFPLGSPWLERVNRVILKLQYEGEMDRLKEFWLAGACHTKRKKSNNNKGIGNGVSSATLGILNFTSAFIFLLAGTGLAIIVFAMEFCFTWFGRKKLSSWSNKDWCHLISLSMGMTLSFRESVREAMEAHRKEQARQCKSAVCETKLWKAQFQLKQARFEIVKLQSELDRLNPQHQRVQNESTEHDQPEEASEDFKDNPDRRHSITKTDDAERNLCQPKCLEEPSSTMPHLAQVHSDLHNGDVTRQSNQSNWPACLLSDNEDDEDEEKSVRVTLL